MADTQFNNIDSLCSIFDPTWTVCTYKFATEFFRVAPKIWMLHPHRFVGMGVAVSCRTGTSRQAAPGGVSRDGLGGVALAVQLQRTMLIGWLCLLACQPGNGKIVKSSMSNYTILGRLWREKAFHADNFFLALFCVRTRIPGSACISRII